MQEHSKSTAIIRFLILFLAANLLPAFNFEASFTKWAFQKSKFKENHL